MNGSRQYMLIKDVIFCTVPRYPELSFTNIISRFALRQSKKMVNYCPEIEEGGEPLDRVFFFNIFNTLHNNIMAKIIYEQTEKRSVEAKIPNKITIKPEFQDIFTGPYLSLIHI